MVKEAAKMILTVLFLAGMLFVSASSFTGCAHRVVVIPADQVIKPLENGNYEVTPAWLKARYEYEKYLTEELKKCRKQRQ